MRTTLPALALAFAALGGAAPALSQSNAPAPLPMQFGQRVQLGPMMGERIVREVMVSQGGGGLTVIYDEAMPSTMALGSGGAPRLVQGGGGMYSVEYGPR